MGSIHKGSDGDLPSASSGAPKAAPLGRPARIFISHSHLDGAARDRLVTHLTPLRRAGLIEIWHDREIAPGVDWLHEINEHLGTADIVLLLVSADFLASEYCHEKEMEFALKRHDAGLTRVIPVVIRPVDWSGAPFARLQGLPREAKPVSSWGNQDEAWLDVAKGIRRVAEAVGARANGDPPR